MNNSTKSNGQIQRIVVKFGTAILTLENGRLNEDLIGQWVSLLSDLKDQGKEIVIVTSGAVGAGVGELNLPGRPKSLPDKQAVAAIGQSLLMRIYNEAFHTRGYHVAQVLLTRGDMDDRRRHLNVRNCLNRLLEMGVVPIINENDTVVVDELAFGDNDILSAIIASKIQADLLGIFSDVEGLYDCDPRTNPAAQVVPLITSFNSSVEAMASKTTSALGSGGMHSKILAAQAANRAGVPVVIAYGRTPENLKAILVGAPVGTRFLPSPEARLNAKERWIALGAHTSSRQLIVDHGARSALVAKKKSLLPAGVKFVKGNFRQGDVVEICDVDGHCFAKGLTNYSSAEIERIRGHKTSEIEVILGENRYDEVVHRDNLVVLDVE